MNLSELLCIDKLILVELKGGDFLWSWLCNVCCRAVLSVSCSQHIRVRKHCAVTLRKVLQLFAITAQILWLFLKSILDTVHKKSFKCVSEGGFA